ncbi:AaceriAEL117Cp [[Ashbya] aceris (nom. inval.)]|nr:AaceriAEL117Cp [[Ashbya] aceris (nom. inval.)]
MLKQRQRQVVGQLFRRHRRELVHEYILVPIGVICFMALLYGVDRLIRNVIGVKFPASVAVMLVNLGVMCTFSAISRPLAERYVAVVDVPLSWSLRWMNLFFTPAFVTLPLSEWISAREAMLIMATFVVGYLVGVAVLAYVTVGCQRLFGKSRKSVFTRQHELDTGEEEGSRFAQRRGTGVLDSPARTESTMSITEYRPAELQDVPLMNLASHSGILVSRTATQEHTGSSVGLNEGLFERNSSDTAPAKMQEKQLLHDSSEFTSSGSPTAIHEPAPSRKGYRDSSGLETDDKPAFCERAITRQVSHQLDRLISVQMLRAHLHHILYGLGFVASMFSYYFSWYLMPYHLFTAVCAFMFVADAPLVQNPKYKRFMHPVLCSVALTWLVMLISVMIKHRRVSFFLSELHDYKTGRTYLHLFDTAAFGDHVWPGAGDVFSSCMDVSIVGLSMPMFTYRADLRRHFASMIPAILILSTATLILYPLISHLIGIRSDRAIGFVGRSITLALATPTVDNLHGSMTLMAVTTVVSGVVGALTGGPHLDLLRIRSDDYVTRGVTLGCNCGAIATAYLLGVDRRAAAISSLSFVIFGTFMVILSSIGPIQTWVYHLATL